MESLYESVDDTQKLRYILDGCEAIFGTQIDGLVQSIDLRDRDMRNNYQCILDVIFDPDVTWGRIISAAAFTYRFAVKAFINEENQMACDSIEWFDEYMMKDPVSQWVNSNGGWVSNGSSF